MNQGSAFHKPAQPTPAAPRQPTQEEQEASLRARLASARTPVVITGAGVDTPSGIPPLRHPETGAEPEGATGPATRERLPVLWGLWDRFRRASRMAPVNPAHKALVSWQAALDEQALPEALTIITTNVTGLHHRAGSRRVVEMRGNVYTASCLGPKGHPVTLSDAMFAHPGAVPGCPVCERPLRPGVTLAGEDVRALERSVAEEAMRRADLVVVAGSSGRSTTTRTLVNAARKQGTPLVLINDKPWEHAMPFVAGASGNTARLLPTLVPSPRS